MLTRYTAELRDGVTDASSGGPRAVTLELIRRAGYDETDNCHTYTIASTMLIAFLASAL